MTTENSNVMEINTLEEYTTHCLDRSLEGLEELRRCSIHCGETLKEDPSLGYENFHALCQNLRDFYVFEGDIRTVFMLDTDLLCDRQGSLKETEDHFETLMQQLPEIMGNTDSLSEHLCISLPGIIDRFQDLLPTLRNYIEDEYINFPG